MNEMNMISGMTDIMNTTVISSVEDMLEIL